MTQQKYTSPYPKNISDTFKISNHTQAGWANLTLRFAGNAMRVTAYAPGGKQPVRLVLTPSSTYLLLNALKAAIKSEKGSYIKVEVTRYDREKKDRVTSGYIYVGKDDEGIMYIGLEQYNRDKCRFYLTEAATDLRMQVREGDNLVEVTPEKMSRMFTESLITMLEMTYAVIMVTQFYETAKKDNGGNRSGGNGGGNNYRQNSQPDQDSSNDDDDWL